MAPVIMLYRQPIASVDEPLRCRPIVGTRIILGRYAVTVVYRTAAE